MAKAEEVTGEAPAKRTRKASGPRKARPTHVLFRVKDADGNPVENAVLDIVIATKDGNELIDAYEANKDASRARFNF